MNKFKFIAHEKCDTTFAIGDKIKINGKIQFGQDFSFWEGNFDDLIFTVLTVLGKYPQRKLSLVAPKYGENPGTDSYGNGAIFIYENEFDKLERI